MMSYYLHCSKHWHQIVYCRTVEGQSCHSWIRADVDADADVDVDVDVDDRSLG